MVLVVLGMLRTTIPRLLNVASRKSRFAIATPTRNFAINTTKAITTTRTAGFQEGVGPIPISIKPTKYSSSAMGDNSEMDYERVKAGLEDNSIILIDVRTTEERKEKHGAIPGSKHIWGKIN